MLSLPNSISFVSFQVDRKAIAQAPLHLGWVHMPGSALVFWWKWMCSLVIHSWMIVSALPLLLMPGRSQVWDGNITEWKETRSLEPSCGGKLPRRAQTALDCNVTDKYIFILCTSWDFDTLPWLTQLVSLRIFVQTIKPIVNSIVVSLNVFAP